MQTPFDSGKSPSWIWIDETQKPEPNLRVVFERNVVLETLGKFYGVRIAADSRYRLWVNGKRVGDGPARFFPDAPSYDEIEVSGQIKVGQNLIVVEVLHFGVDTFQYIRGEPGLWFGLYDESNEALLLSDQEWGCCILAAHVSNTPRISPQLGFEEQWDFTREQAALQNAVPSKRKTAPSPPDILLCQEVFKPIKHVTGISRVESLRLQWTMHVRELFTPFRGGVNVLGLSGFIGTEVVAEVQAEVEFCILGEIEGFYLDGQSLDISRDQDLAVIRCSLSPGRHWVAIGVCTRHDHVLELSVGMRGGESYIFESPVSKDGYPWVATAPLWSCDADTNCPIDENGKIVQSQPPFFRDKADLLVKLQRLAGFRSWKEFPEVERCLFRRIQGEFFSEADAYFTQRTDRVIDGRGWTGGEIVLAEGERVELDFEEITNGFIGLEVESDGPFTVDGYFFEYLSPDTGRIQHMQNDGLSYRNSFRCRFRKGGSDFTSVQRRGFRYIILSVREAEHLVRVRSVRVLESIYPAPQRAEFKCSDERLNRIFEMSQRTLALCMEDTFTDCPSYEQALWVGDSRNESLFAAVTFGAYDYIEHSSRLVAYSAKSLPMACCQCPSGWDTILPSFSFLWVVSVWEAYLHSGRKTFLREVYGGVKRTLETSLTLCSERDLFSAPTWNFFDWAPIDQGHDNVIHNSMLLCAALESGIHIARVLGEIEDISTFESGRKRIVAALDDIWDDSLRGYPDAILPDGRPNEKTSQHTSILALKYGLTVNPDRRAVMLANCVEPPPSMTKVGSPFAMFFLLEVLLQQSGEEVVLETLRQYWGRMLDAGATSCWEMVKPEGSEFPTRSHCHGWSAAPSYLLPKVFFGLDVLDPGWRVVRVRPQIFDLDAVTADVCTPWGKLKLSLRRLRGGSVSFDYTAPEQVKVEL